MTEPERILAVPRAPDALPEALVRVSVELPAGQAALTVPIRTPAGRNGLQPQLVLAYASASGPGPFGVGWSLPLDSVKKVGERYFLERAGGGELVALGGGRFRPRADEKFARLQLADNRWRIRERDGRVHELAEISPGRWSLERTSDSFGHRVEYRWESGRLTSVRWLEHGRGTPQYLAEVAFDYEGARCRRIRVLSHAGETSLVRSYELEHDEAQNGWLMLRRIRLTGHDGERTETLPPVELDYAPFDPSRRRFVQIAPAEVAELRAIEQPTIDGREQAPPDFPHIALDDARVRRVDLSGDARADLVIVRDRSIVYWPKLADGGWGAPVRMEGAPELPDFSPARVFLGDVDGDGLADLVYVGDRDVRLYINRGGRGWSLGAHIQGTPSPAGGVRLVSLPGGSTGVVWEGARPWLLDLTGGARPYLLRKVADPIAGIHDLEWAPFSTGLPRPVQVLTKVRSGPHTVSYVYENAVWRGGFRGFGHVERREGGESTHTWFGTDGKSAGRPIRRERRRGDGTVELGEWRWGAPAGDSVYGVVLAAERTGQRWRFWAEHDNFGQPASDLVVDGEHATLTRTQFAGREETAIYLVDRPARITRHALDHDEHDAESLARKVAAGEWRGRILADTLHHYDGQPFVGLPLGQVGKHGALVRTEKLAFTEDWLRELGEVPIWLKASRPEWPGDEYPKAFRASLPPLGGYIRRPVVDGGRELEGWYVIARRRRYDFQEAGATPRGRVTLSRDALEHDTALHYDGYELMPAKVSDPRGLATQAAWDYRLMRPKALVAASGGRTAFGYSPLGLVERRTYYARPADERPVYQIGYLYDSARRTVTTARRDSDGEALERIEHFDAAGRLVETEVPGPEVAFPPLSALDTPEDAVAEKSEHLVVLKPVAPASERVADGPRDLLGRSWGTPARLVARDAAGLAVEERNAGALVLRAFDAAGREVRRWARDRADEKITLRVWRIFGDSIESGLTVQRAAEANLLGRLHKLYDEAGQLEFVAYDSEGRLLERARRPLSAETVAAGPVDWQPHGNLSLDSHARALLDERSHRTQFRWDLRGRMIGVTHPEDFAGRRREARFGWDRLGRLQSLDLDGKVIIEHAAWDAAGHKVLVAWGNGVLSRWARDGAGRAIRLRSERYERKSGLHFSVTGRVLQDYWCSRDEAGRIVQLIDDSPDAGLPHRPHRLERAFSWDDEGQLVGATGRESGRSPDWPWEDAPRPAEVVQTRAYSDTYEWRDGRLVKQRHDAGRGSFTREWIFDDDGHLVKLSGSDGYMSYQVDGQRRLSLESSVRRFLWDHAGRLQRYRWGEDPPQIDLVERYDESGARVLSLLRRAEGESELRVSDGGFVHELGEGERNWLHLSVGDWRIASVRSGPPRAGEPAAQERRYLEDLDGSITLTLDDEGNELGREGYSPLGETSWGGVAGQPFRFHGAERDSHTGLYVKNGRPYAPWLGRFIDDSTVLPELHAAPQKNSSPQVSAAATDSLHEIFRIPIVDRGQEHGERELPHPGTSHRPDQKGSPGSPRRGVGQGADLR